MADSLKDRILRWYKARPGQWISSAAIEKVVMENTSYIASNASRQCRMLFEEGKLERTHRKSGKKMIAWYRFPASGVTPRQQILKDNTENVAAFDAAYAQEQLEKKGFCKHGINKSQCIKCW